MIFTVVDAHIGSRVDDNLWAGGNQDLSDRCRVRAIRVIMAEGNDIAAPGLSKDIDEVGAQLSGAADHRNPLAVHGDGTRKHQSIWAIASRSRSLKEERLSLLLARCPMTFVPGLRIDRLIVFTILTGSHMGYPFRVIEIPFDGLSKASGKIGARLPAGLGAYLRSVDSVTPIVPRAIGDRADTLL